MSSNSKAGVLSSSSNNSSTLRPRSTRLISYLEEESDNPITSVGGNVTSSSSTTVRHASPSSGLRATSATRKSGKQAGHRGLVATEEASRRGSGANGLWDSWTQIQGIASTILGSDASTTNSNTNLKSGSSFKTPAWMKQDRSYHSARPEKKWGPRGSDHIGIGPGSIEERQATLQAKKREALLLAASSEGKDASGRFKRKGSDASLSIHSPTRSDDTLVYRHKVLPNDTMAGVTIKYSCHQETFRKVNRLWPNDRIQIRDHVLLPVDACSVRGKKIGRPDTDNLLEEDLPASQIAKDVKNPRVNGVFSESDQHESQGQSTTSSVIDEVSEDYIHDSWVLLPNFPHPVEILRIPRPTIGYFPPARRKSNQHLLTTGIESAISSPRTSLDTLRHPPSHAAQQAQLLQQQNLRSVSAESSTQQGSRPSHPLPTTSRYRSHSLATTSSQQTNIAANPFFSALRGPGGVGNLRGLRTESSRPGPADDTLNQNFAKYLPSLALTIDPGEDDYTGNEYAPSLARAFTSNQTLGPPRASMDSLRSSRSGRSNSSTSAFGAGVENWVKKIASATAGATRPSLSRTNSDRTIGPAGKSINASGIGIGGETGLGDLIELETNADTRNFLSGTQNTADHANNDDGSETPRLGGATSKSKRTSNKSAPQTDQEDLLNERFPVRGKVTKAYNVKK